MKPEHGTLDVTATGSAATAGAAGEAAGPPSTRMISAECDTATMKVALTPFAMSFYMKDAFERSQLSCGIVSLSTYDPVYPVASSVPAPCKNWSDPKCINVSQVSPAPSVHFSFLILVNVEVSSLTIYVCCGLLLLSIVGKCSQSTRQLWRTAS